MRTVWHPSVTVAAIVEQEGRFLMVEEETAQGIRLNQPAGHLEEGESLLEAVIRETLEETACPFTPHALIGSYLTRASANPSGAIQTYLRFAFSGSVGQALARPLDQGIIAARFMTLDAIRASSERHRSPLVLRCIEDYLRGQRFALDALHTDPSIHESRT